MGTPCYGLGRIIHPQLCERMCVHLWCTLFLWVGSICQFTVWITWIKLVNTTNWIKSASIKILYLLCMLTAQQNSITFHYLAYLRTGFHCGLQDCWLRRSNLRCSWNFGICCSRSLKSKNKITNIPRCKLWIKHHQTLSTHRESNLQ